LSRHQNDRDKAWKDYDDAKDKCDSKKKEYDAKVRLSLNTGL